MFRAEASKISTGSYTIQSTCQKQHTSYRKSGDTTTRYQCPYCGSDVK